MIPKQIDERVAALLKEMTLEEKIGQLAQFSKGQATGPENIKIDQKELIARGCVGSVLNLSGAKEINELQRVAVEKSRLKIPLIFGLDVIHGYRTVYPIPLGLAASWNPDIAEKCARMAAVEGTAEGLRWTFSPMIDVTRDARWGRVTEGNGEDTFLCGVLAAAWVRGYQNNDLAAPTSMLACAKHFVAYGGAEGGREYDLVDVSDRVLRDVYLPPFKAALDAGVGTFMSAFNALQGVPTSGAGHTLTGILRKEWGFQGFVVSDWNSVGELVQHGFALDGSQAAFKGLTAGVDMDMQSNLYITELAGLVGSGKLKPEVIDESVSRILRVKFALGLFERPYADESAAASAFLTPGHLDLARRAAEESFVLMKNEPVNGSPLLPLGADKTVALIGALADSQREMLGAWAVRGREEDVVSLRQSLSERLKEKLIYARGTGPTDDSEAGFAEALAAVEKADIAVLALGETLDMSGEAASCTTLDMPGGQLKLLKAIVATGKPVVLVLFNGRPLSIPWEAAHVPAILEAWFPGVQAGPALSRVLYGDVNPAGKLTASFPYSVGQMPLYYNTFNTGRPILEGNSGNRFVTGYTDQKNKPLFPFGWGLSYTKFDYSTTSMTTTKISVEDLKRDGAIHVQATVTNAGTRAGAEIVQLYIRQRGASVVRPIRELKGFEKIMLNAGESRLVQFALTKEELAFWNIDMEHTVEPCELTVWIAPNSVEGIPAKIMIGP